MTLWAAVVSRPEPGLAILNAGRRDTPAGSDIPRPAWRVARDAMGRGAPRPEPLDSPATVIAANDHHLFMAVEPASPLAPGDLVGLGTSHPCLVMDRWRVVPVVTEDGAVVDAVHTFF